MEKPTITTQSVVVAAPLQVACDLEGDAVILNLKDGVYYGLDPVGAYIWGLVQAPSRVETIRDAIVETYDVTLERCTHDLLVLLEELASKGLVEVRGGTST